ncbi:hypothetical protein MATL_G00171330 [Megalops atlanticus]|uniref:Matrin-3 n=1 Tax=Megalops atlanticus TaxID=7932 RepID=A0A9D3PNX9_MEGAT|nr:hypothetical protein MATL_G00171330 [Megalops atlanticus]
MSQKIPPEGAQKGFAVGRGLLAAAETLNFSMNEQRPDSLYGTSFRPSYSMAPTLSSGDGKDRDSQLPRRGVGHLNNSMKLFASLGLSPTDIDALAQIPEESISIETLPQLIMQLKNRKLEASRGMGGSSRDLPPLSPEHSYRAPRDDWEDVRAGRSGGSSGQSSARGQQMDYGYSSLQEVPSRGYERIDYSESSSGGVSRDRQYSDLSRDRYGGLGMGSSSASDSGFMQKRMGSPSQGKVRDFLGVMPHMFPHVCSLCDFDVHSTSEWTQHTNGLRHAENRRLHLQMYPDWDPQMAANRASGSLLLDATNRSDGILGPAPLGLPRGGMNPIQGADMSSQRQPFSVTPKMRGRVVVAKYERKPLTLNSLLVLAQPFGTVCQHLVLNKKAFLEMQTHEEAVAMVNFYQRKPAVLHGKVITLYLSQELRTIEKGNRDTKSRPSQVVFFSNLPREREKKSELLTLARRFGTVQKYLFLNEEAFIQMGTPEDAEMMVKYYTLHPLTIKGRSIRLNICTKYKTLIVNPSRHGQGRDDISRKSSSVDRKRSPKRPRSQSTSERSSKGQEESAGKEEELEADDSAALGEGSGDERTSVMEAEETEEGSYEGAADSQEAGQVESIAEDVEEKAASATLAPQSLAEESVSEPAETMGKACEASSAEEPKGTEAEEPPSQAEAFETEGENLPEEIESKAAVPSAEQAESSEIPNEEPGEDEAMPMEQDFPENMDEFVTLDEVAEEEDADGLEPESKSRDSSSEASRSSGGWRPFGKVVRHLVLDARPEAFLELSSEEEARSMVAFYNANVTPVVCGKAVKIHHSQAYATIQSGRVLYISQLPPFKTSDASFLKIAEPFGKVRRYFLNRSRNECFIEMESREDTERMAKAYRENPPKFQGKRLTVYVSRKYKQLKYGLRPPPPDSEEERPSKRQISGAQEDSHSSSPAKSKVREEEEPPAKKACREDVSSSIKEENDTTEVPVSSSRLQKQEEEEGTSEIPHEQVKVTVENTDQKISQASDCADTQKDTKRESGGEGAGATPSNGVSEKSCEREETPSIKAQADKKPPPTPVPLGPYQPNNPVGVEYVKMGYYCSVCFLFYSKEETAKKVHCSSLSHYQKLEKHLEKEKEKEKEKAKFSVKEENC